VFTVELVRQPGAEQIVGGFALWLSWTHRKSPEIAMPNRASGILRYCSHAKNPSCLNALQVFRGD
jgi:hypothetical protein